MPVKIRLARHGKKHNAYYHIVIADSRAPRDGKFIEVIGKYNPQSNPATIELDNKKALEWLNKGAQPTDTLKAMLSYKGVLFQKHLDRGVKKGILTQEAADAKFQLFMEEKHNKIADKRNSVISSKKKELENRLEEEKKKKEVIAERVRIKNTPPPAEEAPAATEVEASAPAAEEGASEAPAAE